MKFRIKSNIDLGKDPVKRTAHHAIKLTTETAIDSSANTKPCGIITYNHPNNPLIKTDPLEIDSGYVTSNVTFSSVAFNPKAGYPSDKL